MLEKTGFDTNFEIELRSNVAEEDCDYRFSVARPNIAEGDLVLDTSPLSKVVSVNPIVGDVWSGSFECGPEGISGFYPTPSPDTVCCILKGQGYWVPVLTPGSYQLIPVIPIKEVISIVEMKLIIFVNYTSITAFDETGLKWSTERLSWDGLKIDRIVDERIEGRGWDSPKGEYVPFTVQLDSGTSSGGSSPANYGLR